MNTKQTRNTNENFTPGPWRDGEISQESGRNQFWITSDFGSVKCPFLMHPAEVLASAKLICAAPELLAACMRNFKVAHYRFS